MAVVPIHSAPSPRVQTQARLRGADLSVVAPGTAAAVLVLGVLEFHGAFLIRHWGPIAAFTLIAFATRGARLSGGATSMLVITAWAYAAWSLASAGWSSSPEAAVEGGARNLFYAATLTLPLVAFNSRASAVAVAQLVMGGLALVVATTFVELLATGSDALLAGRLSEPIGYRNGTAALLALASLPLLCVSATRSAWLSVRTVAFALTVAALALAFMTQSRGVIVGFGTVPGGDRGRARSGSAAARTPRGLRPCVRRRCVWSARWPRTTRSSLIASCRARTSDLADPVADHPHGRCGPVMLSPCRYSTGDFAPRPHRRDQRRAGASRSGCRSRSQ